MYGERTTYVVRDVRAEAPGFTTISFADIDGSIPSFKTGQLIDVYFPDTGLDVGKPYSISSAPGEKMLAITVHAIGEFSRRLTNFRVGETFSASLPYGSFRPKDTQSDVIMLAAGMGVSAFRSFIYDALIHTPHRRLVLMHTAKTRELLIYKKEFEKLKSHMDMVYFVTSEHLLGDDVKERRLTIKDVIAVVRENTDTEFLICGPFSFTESMRSALKNSGISKDSILVSTTSTLAGVFC